MFKLAIVGGITMVLFSCQKSTLNPTSTTSLSDVTAFQTIDRIDNQVKGIYSALKSGQMYGGRYFLYNDSRSENFISDDGNRVTVRAPWEFSINSGDDECRNLWAAAYTAINRANLFLDGMEATGNAVAGDKAKVFNGEARFGRAMAYYSLLQLYARPYWDGNGSKRGLPLRLKGIKGPGSNNLASSTVAEVYKQIIDDLDFAETNMNVTVSDATTRTIRAHRNTAIALKVRAYLAMRDYAKVITEANKIVSDAAPFKANSGVAHALATNITTLFAGTSTDLENIFSMPFTLNDAPGTQNQLGHYYRPASSGGAGIFFLNRSAIAGDASWKNTDSRRKLMDTVSGKTYLKKFNSGAPWLDWAPVLRYSEVLLSLAEALARGNAGGVDNRAVALLNAVRNRSDAATTFTAADFANSAALVDAIIKERNIEFLGEGIRGLDITRLGLISPVKQPPTDM
ncbi:RagB/SusD family nutrient uptake outer membrane protein [Paraflavitalea speifideaquila]|uniref:RagB/SusD family nutrient uptake outer membrane protein n=1 Tax=Paraflavitalea speifideaquila TaxID=3076558 RepID=UPI0028E88F80|nr:RagB/SusD family nutrient uptake outer membrane protein [Paraflavitalea speifideiaquila]